MAADNRSNKHLSKSSKFERKTDPLEKSSVLQSAVLQDHWTRRLNLDDGRIKKNLNHPLPVTKKRNPIKKEKSETTGSSKIKNGGHNNNIESLEILTKATQRQEQIERVLDDSVLNLPKKLSLAEKYGILPTISSCEASAMKKISSLSEKEWSILKRKSIIRGDICSPCPICKELFTFYKRQVLLSCSHTFHLKCIHSFEKYSGKKSCPICRYENYNARLIFDGAHLVSNSAAIKIQSKWRSYFIRKHYLERIKDHVPSHPSLKKRYFQSKFLTLADKLVCNYDVHNADVDKLIDLIDQNISISKSIMETVDTNIRIGGDEDKWNEIRTQALKRNCSDCPICLSKFCQIKKMVVLTCSHIFHENCLVSFEEYSALTNKSCPVCRSAYLKKPFNY